MRGGEQVKCEGRGHRVCVLNASVQPKDVVNTMQKGGHWLRMGRLSREKRV